MTTHTHQALPLRAYLRNSIGTDKYVIAPALTPELKAKGYMRAVPPRRFRDLVRRWEKECGRKAGWM